MDNVDACESELWETTDSEDETTDVPGDELHKEGESESLSDIDDAEIGSYLNNEKEKNFKKTIWEMMNQEYLQEQAAKRVAAANVTNSKTDLRHKRATGVKKTQSTAKPTCPTSPKKRPHYRINYDALSKSLDEPSTSDNNPQKRRKDVDSDKIVGESSVDTQLNEEVAEESEDEVNGWEDDPDYSHYNNQEEEYDYYDDDDEFF
ncbi:uncharacterized protein LOC104888251 isoform X1 [Beta vulgaris subsp. vulgaris]|uniref:uncharacterized protein LOC104888251 isoform X1 n=1 Tax=Beta vulgaris subsp. vulgaris TaxID=3555 RepID=UPI002036CC14|nr:uncharacterized protein LOC104888251 isoform X1 [Beta vulgaris subsp. vulgaris]XP_048496822.1 uncharacterized protein LOC104888251 isoform X1 [Beta vulgaris subsp. vulgaris]XP_048496823.1 uncharacterized protein LOC104888251 isoform X1 [Beta vulgaris subsp. vulgaris]